MDKNFEIFNLEPEDFKVINSNNQTEIYRVDAKMGKNNVYKSIIRFLPYWKNPKESIIQKWAVWLQDPETGESRFVDCPTSIGKPSILYNIYKKLKNSSSLAEQQLAINFSRRRVFASLVQIIKDDNRPELTGRIMVFIYGIKIYNKIMNEIYPEFGKPHIPFDIFNGKPFALNVKLIAGYNNYDDSKFLDESIPLIIDGEPVKSKDEETYKKVIEFLKTGPDLGKYAFKEWDSNTEEFVKRVIKNTIPSQKLIESIYTENKNLNLKNKNIEIDNNLPNIEKNSYENNIINDNNDIINDIEEDINSNEIVDDLESLFNEW